MKLYHHKTDGGAEYLCTSPVKGTDEGDLSTAIIRLDGEPELIDSTYAAAPELLEALENSQKSAWLFIASLPDCPIRREASNAYQAARAAIQKARGTA